MTISSQDYSLDFWSALISSRDSGALSIQPRHGCWICFVSVLPFFLLVFVFVFLFVFFLFPETDPVSELSQRYPSASQPSLLSRRRVLNAFRLMGHSVPEDGGFGGRGFISLWFLFSLCQADGTPGYSISSSTPLCAQFSPNSPFLFSFPLSSFPISLCTLKRKKNHNRHARPSRTPVTHTSYQPTTFSVPRQGLNETEVKWIEMKVLRASERDGSFMLQERD